MRIRRNNEIIEADEVRIDGDRLVIGLRFYDTGEKTEEIARQLLKSGFADLTEFSEY